MIAQLPLLQHHPGTQRDVALDGIAKLVEIMLVARRGEGGLAREVEREVLGGVVNAGEEGLEGDAGGAVAG